MSSHSIVNVLLIENQQLIRLGIRAAVEDAADIEIAGETADLAAGFDLFSKLRPDVVIMGLRFPDACSTDRMDDYFAGGTPARMIVLADHAGDSEIKRALKKGALGYICKDIAPADLLKAIRTAAAGRRYIPADIAGILGEHIGQEELTPTEENVLRMIVGGISNKEIAFALDVSENTIKTHVQNIFGKIGVSDRTSAATTAIKRGLVRVDL
jgi:DNA-binding NarL/FixJ family response regulator